MADSKIESEMKEFREYLENELNINSQKTIKDYVNAVRKFRSEFKTISEFTIKRFLKKRRNPLYVFALKKYVQFKGLNIEIPRIKYEDRKPLDYEFEWQEFLDALQKLEIEAHKPERVKDVKWIILLGVFTGRRISEILKLKVKHLNKEERSIIIVGKRNIRQKIRVPKVFDDFFTYVLEEKGLLDNEYCFFEDIQDRNYAYNAYRYYIQKSNLPEKYKWMLKKTHNWRRAVAMYILKRTGDIFKAKEVLGHRSINTTMRYVREWMQEKAREEGFGILVENYTDEIEKFVEETMINVEDKGVDWYDIFERAR